jgi:hypothetical protein
MAKKPFINPLTRSSEQELNITPTPEIDAPTVSRAVEPKQKKPKFEDTHERFTGWARKDLKQGFLELVEKRGTSKTAVLNEALELLLHRQDRKPYTKKAE